MHFLMETAIASSRDYKILSAEDVDARERELATLSSRIEATQYQLGIEAKTRDATISADKASAQRSGGRDSNGKTPAKLSQDAAQSIRKYDETAQELAKLERRRQVVQTSLLEHTAGVLQATHKGYLKKEPGPDETNINSYLEDFADASYYRPYSNFVDSALGESFSNTDFAEQNQTILDVEKRVEELNRRMREMILKFKPDKRELPQPAPELRDDPDHPADVLLGQVGFMEQCLNSLDHLEKSEGFGAKAADHVPAEKHGQQSQFLVDVEGRVEDLNMQVRSMILDMNPAKEDLPNPAQELSDDPQNPMDVLDGQMGFLERCLETVKRLQERDRSRSLSDNALEEKMETINTKLFEIMTAHDQDRASKYTPPPEALGQSLPDQVDYLGGGLSAVYRRLKELNEEADGTSEQLKSYQGRAEKYASVVGGLWDLLNPPDVNSPGGTPMSEKFSLQAFSTMVQDMHRKYSMLEDQKVVLTRQIQQQRELNATADTAKDSKLIEAREQLEKTKAELQGKHEEASTHGEKLGVVQAELEAVKRTLALRDEQQSMGDAKALSELKAQASEREAELISQIEAKSAAATKTEAMLQELEADVVRLRTELTMAKAALDSAHGTRAQRAAEAAGETPELRARIATLEQELRDTINDYQAMTRASIEFEKEREALENAADGLRDRVEGLEAALAEERIQGLGAKSPTGEKGTGAAVLKTEFRKMMRETRTEHIKALRVSSSPVLAL